MKRFLHAQRVVVILLAAALLVALGIGLWPVTANVFGDASYSCGSGFIHSAGTWNRDTSTLEFTRLADGTAHGTPATLCPNKIDNRRDLALMVLAFSLAVGIVAQIAFERPRARNYRSTMFVNRRRAATRAPAPPLPTPQLGGARPQPDESRAP